MKSDDLVSFIIPIFNSAKFLDQTIESIFNQTYHNIEIIAVNDGSTDNSLDILHSYGDKITIINQENFGLAHALNVGLKKITGKWFRWFSPDDILYPESTEILVDQINKFKQNTIVYSNWDLINEKNKILRSFSESNYNDLKKFDYNVRLLDGQQINVNTAIIPVSLVREGCIFKEIKDPVAIDYDFFLRAGLLYDIKFYLISQSLVKYRISSSQLSHQNITKSLKILPKIKHDILLNMSEQTRNDYLNALDRYNKNKRISKKSLEIGLNLSTKILPQNITDKILVFYLNKIRRGR